MHRLSLPQISWGLAREDVLLFLHTQRRYQQIISSIGLTSYLPFAKIAVINIPSRTQRRSQGNDVLISRNGLAEYQPMHSISRSPGVIYKWSSLGTPKPRVRLGEKEATGRIGARGGRAWGARERIEGYRERDLGRERT